MKIGVKLWNSVKIRHWCDEFQNYDNMDYVKYIILFLKLCFTSNKGGSAFFGFFFGPLVYIIGFDAINGTLV